MSMWSSSAEYESCPFCSLAMRDPTPTEWPRGDEAVDRASKRRCPKSDIVEGGHPINVSLISHARSQKNMEFEKWALETPAS
jgi:hypothetical protein